MSRVDAIGTRKTCRCGVPDATFFSVAALVFTFSAALTITRCASMSALSDVPMPGGWMLSMMWIRMCGQTWREVATTALGMWIAMSVAMMLPSVTPTLWRYHRELASRTCVTRPGTLTMLMGVGYFLVWTLYGMVVLPPGIALAALEMRVPLLARAVPFVSTVVVLSAGVLQFTAWKARHLACCRRAPAGERALSLVNATTAWRQGVRLGVHCSYSCAGLTAILLVSGTMDLRAMVAVTTAITAERLAPDGERVARAIGVVVIGAGLFLLARAIRTG
ncbi:MULTISPECIES: DUF2182 domain-containing protein [Paraburkholderia]|uniref:DUF2182 domain-containing protein n=1 Tax=Paraburkholderia TaxID=1822464 RepID=UPI00224D74D7|nr:MULTISPECIES: DUF2182 domain-containing protein [Paraburkholderia]MCX4162884.1 DUF2182 domain-containing protein [Paraburkholderia megapolitana]MDN7158380.1 DUF2182 domain-containing protein [Paraburkholderia sp. CHISQ3]MDQ6495427.1 DUF2182 domain-containing protein [Paraburkholderia megapolitana]